jgi:hypothetical protein
MSAIPCLYRCEPDSRSKSTSLLCLFIVIDKAFTTGLNVLLSGAVQHAPNKGLNMKCSVIAALSAAVIGILGASSAAQAAAINFNFSALDGSILHDGTSLSDSTYLDFVGAIELVTSLGLGDASGLNENDTITLTGETTPTTSNAIIYGSGPGPLGADVILTWPMVAGPGVDMFTETLTTVQSIVTMPSVDPDFIAVTLTGTLTDSDHLFKDAPVTHGRLLTSQICDATRELCAAAPAKHTHIGRVAHS